MIRRLLAWLRVDTPPGEDYAAAKARQVNGPQTYV